MNQRGKQDFKIKSEFSSKTVGLCFYMLANIIKEVHEVINDNTAQLVSIKCSQIKLMILIIKQKRELPCGSQFASKNKEIGFLDHQVTNTLYCYSEGGLVKTQS